MDPPSHYLPVPDSALCPVPPAAGGPQRPSCSGALSAPLAAARGPLHEAGAAQESAEGWGGLRRRATTTSVGHNPVFLTLLYPPGVLMPRPHAGVLEE